jgi:molecular chaperone DnaK
MKSAMEALTQAQHRVAEALYKQTGSAGPEAGGGAGPSGAAGGATSGGGTAPGDVIDAEVVDEK